MPDGAIRKAAGENYDGPQCFQIALIDDGETATASSRLRTATDDEHRLGGCARLVVATAVPGRLHAYLDPDETWVATGNTAV